MKPQAPHISIASSKPCTRLFICFHASLFPQYMSITFLATFKLMEFCSLALHHTSIKLHMVQTGHFSRNTSSSGAFAAGPSQNFFRKFLSSLLLLFSWCQEGVSALAELFYLMIGGVLGGRAKVHLVKSEFHLLNGTV